MRYRFAAAYCAAAAALGGCGTAASPAYSVHSKPAARYLLTLDQLVTPDFTVYQHPHAVSASTVAAGSAAAATRLTHDGLQDAAAVDFFRAADLALANGPVDVSHTVERFAAEGGAADSFQADVAALDSTRGATAVSTGVLGDEAHADSITRTSAAGIRAVQYTVEWRLGNLVNVLVIRGRYGGTQLADALVLAQRVIQAQIAAG